jgi:hypothetical protein
MKTDKRSRVVRWVLVIAGVAAALWYLRDPPWLAAQTTGLRAWQQAADGTRYRWSGRHASFFVAANATRVIVPVATTFRASADKPMVVTFSIDDARGTRVLLTSPAWTPVTLEMPPRGSRRVRRIDVRTSVTRDGNYGVMIGEVRNGDTHSSSGVRE